MSSIDSIAEKLCEACALKLKELTAKPRSKKFQVLYYDPSLGKVVDYVAIAIKSHKG
jgi:hypothetical protein